MSDQPWERTGVSGTEYEARFAALEHAGQDVHGEANFVAALGVTAVLDAGCGTGRVAIELSRRGFAVAGVDRDPEFLRMARQKAPQLPWYLADLATVALTTADTPPRLRPFDAIVMAGNVMIFLDPGTEAAVIANLARHLAPGGFLIAGFQLQPGSISLPHYDAYAADAGLHLFQRWATWDRQPWHPASDYAVSVHRRTPAVEHIGQVSSRRASYPLSGARERAGVRAPLR
jgi:SAM-dependent methyltransferase